MGKCVDAPPDRACDDRLKRSNQNHVVICFPYVSCHGVLECDKPGGLVWFSNVVHLALSPPSVSFSDLASGNAGLNALIRIGWALTARS